jgi:predicted GNAT superfamily acetyltransferase
MTSRWKEAAMTSPDPTSGDGGVTVKEVVDLAEMSALRELFDRAWGRTTGTSVVPLEVLRAASMSGNYVVAAIKDGEVIGGGFGMLGMNGGVPYLHSHVVAVSAELRGRGLGFAVKSHQRTWAQARGLANISWTFDPLVRRNAHFNLNRLGAHPTRYLVNWYGRRDDSIDAGEGDRLLVEWPVPAPVPAPRDAVTTGGAASTTGGAASNETSSDVVSRLDDMALPVRLRNDDGVPVIDADEIDADGEAPSFLADVPGDIIALRCRRPDLAAMWTLAIREVVGEAMSRGYAIETLCPSGYRLVKQSADG